MKEVLKRFFLIVLGYVIFAAGSEIGARVKGDMVDSWKYRSNIMAGLEEWAKISKLYEEEDLRYGAGTEEEIVNLFLEALKKDDLDLASKYFVYSKEAYWKKTLEQIKNEESMEFFIGLIEQGLKNGEISRGNLDCIVKKLNEDKRRCIDVSFERKNNVLMLDGIFMRNILKPHE